MKREPIEVESVVLLREAVQLLREISAKLDRPIPREAAIDPALRALVREIADYLGTTCRFSASELLGESDDELHKALGDMDAVSLGRALARIEGRSIDGLLVHKAGRDERGTIWAISRADDP